ncbi:TMEM43 family protein [Rhizobium sp. KVB221]|uniref:TMEM43 family protein n=1 Tax=Rhizobium setariae TaxID=2801340 RepID=A0A936YIY8_9HYPH|nr:TMEM43 family protein [Rhizobium setariae]MBL0370473.1 TMEM43 family protein [Rhizobium setariae]
MSYTETTTTSWFTRIKNALIGILVGIVLILVSIYFLFWNEGRAIQTYRSLVEGAGLVVSVDSARTDPANDGKLIHITGPVKAEGTVSDDQFAVEADGALAIVRNVEMYQWVEKSESKTEKNLGGSEETTTTYSYSKEWRSSPVDSADFKVPDGHENPSFAVDAKRIVVDSATVGAFVLDGSQVANLGDDKQIRLTEEDVSRIGSEIATDRPVKFNQGDIYLGSSASSPQIGDMKIGFERTDLAEASFVGAQKGDRIEAYTSTNGREILLSAAGKKDAPAMFAQAQQENTIITWLIRAGGLLGLFIGFKLMTMILPVLGDVVPFIGSIVSFGTGILALVFTLVVGPLVIAIGWFAYRPALAIGIIASSLLLAAAFIYLRRKAAAAATTQPALGRTG